ncbi:MAG: hypothetical protein K0R67_59 [Paenibacillus sp.]|nr:hypothetical protein [Paenibacillus sp.]
MGSGYIGYLNYITVLFLASGGYILWLDVRNYMKKDSKREKKASQWSAWINISLGLLMLIGSWFYKRYYW